MTFGISCDVNGQEAGPRHSCEPAGDYLYPIEGLARFFAQLKAPGKLALAAFAGPTNTLRDLPLDQQPSVKVQLKNGSPDLSASCEGTIGRAVPGIRIQALLEHPLFAERGQLGLFNGITRAQREAGQAEPVNVCTPDYGPALTHLGQVLVARRQGCLQQPPLTTEGTLACRAGDVIAQTTTCPESCLAETSFEVELVQAADTPAEKRLALSRCPSELFAPEIPADGCTNCPCWRILPDKTCAELGQIPYRLELMGLTPEQADAIAVVHSPKGVPAWGSAELLALGQCSPAP